MIISWIFFSDESVNTNHQTKLLIWNGKRKYYFNDPLLIVIKIKNRSSTNLYYFFFVDPPMIREAPQNMSVKAGGIAAFRCIASGDPTPHITWRKNGNKIPSLSSSSRYRFFVSLKVML